MLLGSTDGSAYGAAQGRVAMPQKADTRKTTRRSRSSDWLPGGLLVVGICAIVVYFAQDPAAFEQARNVLGFGRKPAAQDRGNDNQVDSDVPEMDPIEAMELPPSDELNEDSTSIAAASHDDSAATNFLPRTRTRDKAGLGRNSPAEETDADSQLDRRFEFDQPGSNRTPVRTAALVQGEEESVSGPDSPESEAGLDGETAPNQAQSKKGPKRIDPDVLHLTAGDDANSPTVGRRPGRPSVQTNPATANSGVKAMNLQEVQALMENGQDAEAYHQLSEAYFQFPSQRPKFQRQLDEVAQRIYFSPQTQIQPPYEIQPGDQLQKIAKKYQLSWQYLSRLNQVDARKIRPGKLLKVFQGPFEAKVDLSDFELTILLDGHYVKRYPVGIGKTNSTPVGEFAVREKLENPTYYGPNGMVLEADDPENPLGERWIDIGNSFGIHGTIEPDSIGKSESAGCIRMRNEDVAEVYDLLTVGSQVRIQR